MTTPEEPCPCGLPAAYLSCCGRYHEGPLAGQAVQLAPATAVVITAFGTAQQPPAVPSNGITVYPTYIIGRGAYGQVMLDDVKFTYLQEADKSEVQRAIDAARAEMDAAKTDRAQCRPGGGCRQAQRPGPWSNNHQNR